MGYMTLLGGGGGSGYASANLVFQDYFIDADNTNITAHTPDIAAQKWAAFGTTPAAKITGQRVQFTAGQEIAVNGFYNSTTLSDYQIFVDLTTTPASNWPALIVRLNSADGSGFYIFSEGSANTIVLSEYDGASFTARGTWSTTYSNGTLQIRVVCLGQTISVYGNGTLLGSYASATRNQSSTKFGMSAWSQASNNTIFFANVAVLNNSSSYVFSSLSACQTLRGVYVIATFLGDGDTQQVLRFLGSFDGSHFVMIPSVYTPVYGICRDTDYYYDGTTHWIAHINQGVLGGVGQPSTSFEVANSSDGINWTTVVQKVDCSAITGNTASSFAWRPCWTRDTSSPEAVRVVIALSSTGDTDTSFQLYELHPTNVGFTTWSAPAVGTKITGTSLCTSLIDPFTIQPNQLGSTTQFIWYKNERADGKVIEVMSVGGAGPASFPLTGYTVLHSGNWAGWGTGIEGSSVIIRANKADRVYMDQYQAGLGVSYSDQLTGDWKTGSSTWSAVTTIKAPFSVVPREGIVHFIG